MSDTIWAAIIGAVGAILGAAIAAIITKKRYEEKRQAPRKG